MKTKSLADQLLKYQSNVLTPLLDKLSQDLHVSTAALQALEIGYALHNRAWVFPERDIHGEVIGLLFRLWDGQKYMFKHSKRGLIYVPNICRSSTSPEQYRAGPHNWVRASEDIPCPICGKPDWCMVSAENPDDPQAVLCGRVNQGATHELEAGFLHIRKPEGNIIVAGSALGDSPHPILIVEGASDVAAAYDLNLVAVGRPSSRGCLDKLASLVAGRSVIVIGENDAGAGKLGMDTAFGVLKPVAKHTAKIMPPPGVKDFRQWVAGGLQRSRFLGMIKSSESPKQDKEILESVAPLELAKMWLAATYCQAGDYTLRVWNGCWYAYIDHCYREVSRDAIRQQLYQFFGELQCKKNVPGGFSVSSYDPTKHKLDEIMDALLAYCPIASEEIPCWLKEGQSKSDPRHILVFRNGYLDVEGYAKRGEGFVLRESTPHYFSLTCYPYTFDPAATCPQWRTFLQEIFKKDPRNIILLQEWFGYNLVPDNSQEKFMLLLGPTRAGKGTILEVLTCILGEDAVLATSFRNFTQRFGLFPFLGKLAAVIGDVSVGQNYDATEALNVIKRITGNDTVTIERKGRDITQTCLKLYTRFTMAANVIPLLPDYARTLEARMLIVKFEQSFMGREDITLKPRLRAEAPGILLWALEGLQRLWKNRGFTLPSEHERLLQQMRGDITPVAEFVGDCCILGEGALHYVYTDYLYECWKLWAQNEGELPRTVRWLNQSITALFPRCKRTRVLVKDRRQRIIHGLKLRPECERNLGVR